MDTHGFLIINKPKNVSSFYCVKTIRNILKMPVKKLRVGHAGTLDDFATGVLIIGIGREATKYLGSLLNRDKKYTVTAKLGELTNTLDFTGTALEQDDTSHITEEQLRTSIKDMGASYKQTPPLYSALKHEGAPLYKLARTQKVDLEKLKEIAEKKSRTVQLFDLELTDFSPPLFTLHTHVSKGTYIRSLVNDIAIKCNTHATTYELTRTAIGTITLDDAIDLETIKTSEDVEKNLLSIEELCSKLEI